MYIDIDRFALRNCNTGLIMVELLEYREELPNLGDVLEPGEIWEIIREGSDNTRVWKKTEFILGQGREYAQQKLLGPIPDTFLPNTPYRLKEWTTRYRVWVDQFREIEVTES